VTLKRTYRPQVAERVLGVEGAKVVEHLGVSLNY
jgi:hypothetical protein